MYFFVHCPTTAGLGLLLLLFKKEQCKGLIFNYNMLLVIFESFSLYYQGFTYKKKSFLSQEVTKLPGKIQKRAIFTNVQLQNRHVNRKGFNI